MSCNPPPSEVVCVVGPETVPRNLSETQLDAAVRALNAGYAKQSKKKFPRKKKTAGPKLLLVVL